MTRHYEHWPAHHHFFAQGRIMLGSNPGMLMVTLILLSGPFTVWIIFIALPLHQLGVLVTGSALLAATLYFLARAALTDPGILPRCTPPPDDTLPEPPSHLFNADGSDLYYCDTCNLFRPPRTKHCRQCDACVNQFDHHCPWVGSCVGLRNYRWFLGFTLGVTSLAGFLCATSVFRLKQRCEQLSARNAEENHHGQSVWTDYLREGINDVPESLCLALFCGLVCVSLLMLLFYHLTLLSKGETTNEQLRRTFQRHVNPYTRGFWGNLRAVLWDPLPPSQLEFLGEEVEAGAIPGMARSIEEMEARRRCNAPPASASSASSATSALQQTSQAATNGITQPASISASAVAVQPYSYQTDLEAQTEHLLADHSVQGQGQ